jgi:hypothetical protein
MGEIESQRRTSQCRLSAIAESEFEASGVRIQVSAKQHAQPTVTRDESVAARFEVESGGALALFGAEKRGQSLTLGSRNLE